MNASFASLILWSLVHAVDPSPAEVARLDAFAADVAAAVDAAPALPFDGPAAREGAIGALLVVAHHEAGFRQEVIDCRVTGDHGRSVSAYQLHKGMAWGPFSREQLCASNQLAAGRALAVLVVHADRGLTPGAMWRAYASGSAGIRSKAARVMCERWAYEMKRAGIDGAACDVSRPLTWRDEER